MKDVRARMLAMLADGRFHSGQQLGDALGVSRSAVWKHVRTLEQRGLQIHAVSGRGYRLAHAVELLDQKQIFAAMDESARGAIAGLELFDALDSTNQYLMQAEPLATPGLHICMAEMQHAGRGRRGRSWESPFACNLYLSMLWRGEDVGPYVSGLGLAMASAVLETMQDFGVEGVGLKWPNDILIQGHKVAGMLIDMQSENAGGVRLVIGVGVNVDMSSVSQESDKNIDQPWTDMQTHTKTQLSRNAIAGVLITRMTHALDECLSGGQQYLERWRQHDILKGHDVDVQLAGEQFSGLAAGIDDRGALLVKTASGLRRLYSGDVSVRRSGHTGHVGQNHEGQNKENHEVID